jgi:predicted RNA-binding protein YlxR (DUF448 family)
LAAPRGVLFCGPEINDMAGKTRPIQVRIEEMVEQRVIRPRMRKQPSRGCWVSANTLVTLRDVLRARERNIMQFKKLQESLCNDLRACGDARRTAEIWSWLFFSTTIVLTGTLASVCWS